MPDTIQATPACEMACMPPDIHVTGCPNTPHRSDVLNYEHFDCCGQGMVPKDEATQTFGPQAEPTSADARWQALKDYLEAAKAESLDRNMAARSVFIGAVLAKMTELEARK